MKVIHIVTGLLLILFSIWLFANEQAAQPGQLSSMHRETAACNDCHTPWRGVSEDMCLNCHGFDNLSALRPEIRFHVAERNCFFCHKEHVAVKQISWMDHTLLHPDLSCDICHFDLHKSQFGKNCRDCHGITEWTIPGFHHPPEERGNCDKCHRAPRSHGYNEFRSMIIATHPSLQGVDVDVDLKECRLCHVTHEWQHLRMR